MLPHDRPLSEVEFVAFDLERTGLFPSVNGIVEFCAVRFQLDGRELGTWKQLVDPKCPIPPEVTAIRGITDVMVQGQPTVVQALPGFLDFLGTPDTILLAYEVTFDLAFLTFAATKMGLTFPSNPVIDTLDLARTRFPGAKRCLLGELLVDLGLAESEDRRGLPVSRLVMALFTHLVGRIKGLRTVGDLFRLCPPTRPDNPRTFLIDAPPGFEGLAIAMEHQQAIVIVYGGRMEEPAKWKITPRVLVESDGRQYMIAYCHAAGTERGYRLDWVREIHALEA